MSDRIEPIRHGLSSGVWLVIGAATLLYGITHPISPWLAHATWIAISGWIVVDAVITGWQAIMTEKEGDDA